MKANITFLNQNKSFWAEVKLISMTLGYSNRSNKSEESTIKIYSINEIVDCFNKLNLDTNHIIDENKNIKEHGKLLIDYFIYRAEVLHNIAKPNLMDREAAKEIFDKLFTKYSPKINIPYNKQKGDKRHYSYLTGIVNILTEYHLNGLQVDVDPHNLVVFTKDNKPIRTLTRRFDGAFPSIINPISIWEIKEYYGTTTFGSRVADGIYETILDGYEIYNLSKDENTYLKHYLIIDDYFTWWKLGRSYLCRLVDILHEGFLDEVIFGKEVLTSWPEIVNSWNIVSTTK